MLRPAREGSSRTAEETICGKIPARPAPSSANPATAAAIAGFALLGAGLAGIFPQIVSSAVRLDPSRAGRNIGRIAAVAYSGLLGGPVAIGAAASGVGLRDALFIPAALAVLVAAAASVLSPHAASKN